MHLLHLASPVDMGKSLGVLPSGDWIVQDQNAFEIALSADRGTATMDNYYGGLYMDDSRTNLLIIRSGAIGDLLLLSPAIRELRIKYPNCRVSLSRFDRHADLFQGTDLFDAQLTYPLPANETHQFDCILSMENVMEIESDVHATDAFSRELGVTVEDYKPVYKVSDQEKTDALAWKKEFGSRPLVGIQLRSSTRNRDYPAPQWAKVILGLEDAGWAVILFGQPGQIPTLPTEMQRPFIFDSSQSGMSLRESVSLLSVCDAFVGVDSSFLHFCHALDRPAVGLFGPIPWKTRTAKAPLTRALTGSGDCAGCGWHAKLNQHFPDMPCRQKQICSVLADITPERIIAAVEKLSP